MKSIFRTVVCALTVSIAISACGSNTQKESESSVETNTGDTAVVMDNDSLANPPTVVDSLNQ